MSVQPVISTNSHAIHQQIEANLKATSSGLSSVNSTITSAATTAAPASGGFCATISAWISSVVEGIRSCLAKLPLIGSCFESTAATSSTAGTSTAVDPAVAADAHLIVLIKGVFRISPAATSGAASTGAVPPAADLVAYALGQFNGIQTQAAKWEALAVVLSAGDGNVTNAIAKEFFDALTPGMQDEFRAEAYRHHGSSVYNGHDHREGFGHYIVHHHIRSPLAIQVARNLQANPVVTP